MAIEPGTRFGPYEIAESIGSGGMGEVYRATDTTLEREVAIKVLPESFAADAERVARFEVEAKTLASLNHPNIAQIYGLERADGVTALVMELIEGQTLAERLEQGTLPVNEAMGIAMQIADALEAAHQRNIVHRDLKPGNIKLTPQGTVKVLDFGIAKVLSLKALSGDHEASFVTPSVTQTGVILGTAAYMSPEQARGKPVDQRTDIWAFGSVLYEMLTGQPAFAGEDVAVTLARVLERHTNLDTLPATISPAVRQALQLCLQKNPKKRIADIRDVRLALEGEFESATIAAPAKSLAQRAGPIAASVLGGAILAGALVWVLKQPELPLKPVSRLLVNTTAEAPLSSLGGWDVMISPDGSQLVYYAQVQGSNRVELYLRDLDTLEARRIPGTAVLSAGGSMLPFYSPDGAHIGYRSPGEGLMRVAVAGGPPINILPDDVIENPQYIGATWASDGTIIFSDGHRLFRVSAGGGGTPVPLTPEPESERTRLIAPVLLPGEKALIYTLDNERVMLLDLESGEQRLLDDVGKNPFYSPSGHIIYARDSTLMAIAFDLDTLTVSGDPVALIQDIRYPGGGTGTDFALSASGTLVYVPATAGPVVEGGYFWVDRDGEVAGVAVDAIVFSAGPRLSGDGNRLAITTGGSAIDAQIWIYHLDGRPPIPLAIEGGSFMSVWSPDNSRLAFRSNQDGASAIFVLPADGSVVDLGDPLPESANLTPMDWLADNTLLAVDFGGVPNIVAMNLDEPAAGWRPVVATTVAEFDPAVSPDGRWLAYVTNRTGGPEVWVRAWPDGVAVRVSRDGGFEPRWSADSSELYFFQNQSVYVVPAPSGDSEFTGTATELFSASSRFLPAADISSYDVAADGRFLLFLPSGDQLDSQAPPSIIVVQNFDEELRQRVPAQ
jgi:Tol biopolymer transport system component